MEKKQDIRLNKDYRTAYIKDFRRHLESQSDNPKYEAYLSALKVCKIRLDESFKTAKKVVKKNIFLMMLHSCKDYKENIILLTPQAKTVVFILQ